LCKAAGLIRTLSRAAGKDLARKRGEVLAAAVEQVLAAKMKPLAGPVKTAFELVDL
jgi:hypothetical protein